MGIGIIFQARTMVIVIIVTFWVTGIRFTEGVEVSFFPTTYRRALGPTQLPMVLSLGQNAGV
jgi:hypothetical protein